MAEIAVLFPQHSSELGHEDAAGEAAALHEAKRIAEALLFAATEPVEESELKKRISDDVKIRDVLEALKADYATRGVNLVRV